MRTFDEIYKIAADRKGSHAALESLLSKPLPDAKLAGIPNDRWLSAMAKCLFQAGFNWKIIEAKWPNFEDAFDGFDPQRVVFYHDEDIDRLLSKAGIVRNGAKISAVINNARFVLDNSNSEKSFGSFIADWPNHDYVGLLSTLAKQGSRIGGVTGQRMLRMMGRDGFILSGDVTARLISESIVDKQPTSKRDLSAVQEAFNEWGDQSGRGLTQISQCLAFSV